MVKATTRNKPRPRLWTFEQCVAALLTDDSNESSTCSNGHGKKTVAQEPLPAESETNGLRFPLPKLPLPIVRRSGLIALNKVLAEEKKKYALVGAASTPYQGPAREAWDMSPIPNATIQSSDKENEVTIQNKNERHNKTELITAPVQEQNHEQNDGIVPLENNELSPHMQQFMRLNKNIEELKMTQRKQYKKLVRTVSTVRPLTGGRLPRKSKSLRYNKLKHKTLQNVSGGSARSETKVNDDRSWKSMVNALMDSREKSQFNEMCMRPSPNGSTVAQHERPQRKDTISSPNNENAPVQNLSFHTPKNLLSRELLRELLQLPSPFVDRSDQSDQEHNSPKIRTDLRVCLDVLSPNLLRAKLADRNLQLLINEPLLHKKDTSVSSRKSRASSAESADEIVPTKMEEWEKNKSPDFRDPAVHLHDKPSEKLIADDVNDINIEEHPECVPDPENELPERINKSPRNSTKPISAVDEVLQIWEESGNAEEYVKLTREYHQANNFAGEMLVDNKEATDPSFNTKLRSKVQQTDLIQPSSRDSGAIKGRRVSSTSDENDEEDFLVPKSPPKKYYRNTRANKPPIPESSSNDESMEEGSAAPVVRRSLRLAIATLPEPKPRQPKIAPVSVAAPVPAPRRNLPNFAQGIAQQTPMECDSQICTDVEMRPAAVVDKVQPVKSEKTKGRSKIKTSHSMRKELTCNGVPDEVEMQGLGRGKRAIKSVLPVREYLQESVGTKRKNVKASKGPSAKASKAPRAKASKAPSAKASKGLSAKASEDTGVKVLSEHKFDLDVFRVNDGASTSTAVTKPIGRSRGSRGTQQPSTSDSTPSQVSLSADSAIVMTEGISDQFSQRDADPVEILPGNLVAKIDQQPVAKVSVVEETLDYKLYVSPYNLSGAIKMWLEVKPGCLYTCSRNPDLKVCLVASGEGKLMVRSCRTQAIAAKQAFIIMPGKGYRIENTSASTNLEICIDNAIGGVS